MIESIKSRRLRAKEKEPAYAVIKPSPNVSEKIVIKENIKVVSFLNLLSSKTQKRYKEVIRSF